MFTDYNRWLVVYRNQNRNIDWEFSNNIPDLIKYFYFDFSKWDDSLISINFDMKQFNKIIHSLKLEEIIP